MPGTNDKISIKGARMHNLKNLSVDLPRDQFIVFTGLSGSGKSSLAFDTIFAEGQRRYMESLSAYARQFLLQLPKPDVDEITGLSPAISIDQKTRSGNPRSTVATLTEIYDYLRLLFARVGKPHCLICGREIKKLSVSEIVTLVREKIKPGQKVAIYAPVVRGRKGEYYQLLYDLLDKGYREVMVNGRRYRLRERIDLSRYKKHDIDVLIDELEADDATGLVERLPRLDSASEARLAEAVERALEEADGLVRVVVGSESSILSARFACPYDGFSYPEVEPRLFSFNSPQGACPACHGLGTEHLFGGKACPVCLGARLRPEALNVLLGGKSIAGVTALAINEAKEFFDNFKWTAREKTIAETVTKEICGRLQFLLDVGLEYLTLDRRAHNLSGGESQRIRLASQLGSRLVGTLYVLDEPTIGLHPRDNARLLKTLAELRDLGNTIIVVEHDEDTIFASDYLVDIGPGAGRHGGEVVAAGPTAKLLTGPKPKGAKASLTLEYLRGERSIPLPEKRRQSEKGSIKIRGAKLHNLQGVDVDIPLGRLVAVTGVSGSGKSTLVHEVLYKNLQARLDRRERSAQLFHAREFSGTESLNRVVLLDQAAIGRTPRSNPATYTGAWGPIRELFAASEGARVKGWGAGRFSFNRPGGRCEACQGNGMVAVEMHFLPTVYVECEVCHGKRFQKETLSVKYQGKNIYEVLKMTVEEALPFFASIPAIDDRLQMLQSVGLGYLELGQPATTLSGGEAQRIKIATELFRPETHRAIYVLDEPTVGLHYEDVRRLIEILQELVNRGNSVITIEHNLDVIKSADYVIDMGPEGGAGGGQIIAFGTPEAVSKMSASVTAKYLKRALK